MTAEHGSAHPLCASLNGERAWRVGECAGPDSLWAWRMSDGDVVLQGDDGDVTIPADKLADVARALLAVHVHNGRPDVPGGRPARARREAAAGPLTVDQAVELLNHGALPSGTVPLP